MSKCNSGWFSGTSGEGQSLIDAVKALGYKITAEDVVGITKDRNDRIIWLERGRTGKNASGLQHILDKHGNQFNDLGISNEDIPDLVLTAVAKGSITGYQGKTKTRPIYSVTYKGKDYSIAVTVGSNGYIVGANPR